MLAVQEEDEKQSSSAQSADPLLAHSDERVVTCIRKVLLEHPTEELLKVFTQSFLNHIQESVNLKGVRITETYDYYYRRSTYERHLEVHPEVRLLKSSTTRFLDIPTATISYR
jgi:hypothetical protein